MFLRSRDKAAWLLVGAAVMLTAGCAAQQETRLARHQADCPMGFTLACDAQRSGATKELSNCRCVRQRDMDAFMRRY